MAKKSSRKSRRQRKPNVPQYQPPEAGDTPTPAVVVVEKEPVTAATVIDWRAEYPFVLGDLRSMFVVAAIMLVILLVLNFVLV